MVVAERWRRAWAAGIVPLLAGLAGCATTHIVECPGPAVPVPARVTVATGADAPALSRPLDDLLTVKVGCKASEYDLQTGQASWSYWVELGNTQATDEQRSATVHLTRLYRQVLNFFDRRIREDAPRTSVGTLYLDAIRAPLAVAPGPPLAFPCAETLGTAAASSGRSPGGLYVVDRRYRGDVAVRDAPAAPTRFWPVEVRFQVGFVLPGPGPELATAEARERAPRRFRWARVSGVCETCRPLLVCESLASREPMTVAASALPVFDASKVTRVHVVAAADRRPVVVDSSLAIRKRTVACTRWAPDVTPVNPDTIVRRVTDSTDEALAPETPFLTFHHDVTVQELASTHHGQWKVELRLGDVLDAWEDLVPGTSSPEQWQARQRRLLATCEATPPVFEHLIAVP